MTDTTVDIKIPENYQGNPVKIFVEKERPRKQGVTTFISFNLDIGGSSLEVDIDVGKSLSKDIAYQVLREKGGLSDKVPTYWSMPLMKMLQFETNPSCYTGPKQFPFVWDGAECSFAAPFT